MRNRLLFIWLALLLGVAGANAKEAYAYFEYADNSLMMLLKVLIRCGVKEVNLAGFDGYSGTDANYLDEGKEYDFAKKKADYLNGYMSGFFKTHKDDIKVNFLTTTRYDIT